MKRFFVAGAALALAMSVGAATDAQDKKTLAFVVNGASDFWKAAEAGVAKAQDELPDYELVFKYPETATAAVQQRLMDDLVAAGVAGIMVSPNDPKHSTESLNRIAENAVLFTTDSDAPDSKRIAYVGSSNVDAGVQAGELMKKAMPDGGKCIMFVGILANDNARERVEGIKESIAGTNIEILDIREDDIDMARAKRNVEDALAANPDIDCLAGLYSYNTPRIYEVVKDAGQLGKIKIIAFDEDPVTLGGVKEGTIVGTVVQQPYQWGYEGMKMMARYIEGDSSFIPENKLIIVPTKIIDQSNVDAFWEELKTQQGKS